MKFFRLKKTILDASGRNGAAFYAEIQTLKEFGPGIYCRTRYDLWKLSRRFKKACNESPCLSEKDIRSRRRSDTVFVFGSGASLNDISPWEWENIARHDTFGFNNAIFQRWVRMDYHLVRGAVENLAGALYWWQELKNYADAVNANPFFRDTVIFLQNDFTATFSRNLLAEKVIKNGSGFSFYKTGGRHIRLPMEKFDQGIVHAPGTLTDVVNLAYQLGWKKIVLAGVDLYDNRYFWLKKDETISIDDKGRLVTSTVTHRGAAVNDLHQTARNGIVDVMRDWRVYFNKRGIELYAYNPKSLLVEVLPVYSFSREG